MIYNEQYAYIRRCLNWCMPKKLTKIHDHPSNPALPDMKEIANASSPEKAPANVAPPQKRPIRYCTIWRGYHMVMLCTSSNRHVTTRKESVRTSRIRLVPGLLPQCPSKCALRSVEGSCMWCLSVTEYRSPQRCTDVFTSPINVLLPVSETQSCG